MYCSEQFDINKLEDQSTNNGFSNIIKAIVQGKEVVADEDVYRDWEKIRRAINSIVITILRKKNSKTTHWFNRNCEEAIEIKKVARRNWLNDTNNETLFDRYKTR